MSNFSKNIYQKVLIKDIENLYEGSLVVIAGLIISLNSREKALIFNGDSYLLFTFLMHL